MLRRLVALAAAAAVLAAVWIGWPRFIQQAPRMDAFAETLAQVRKAKTITWKTTFYIHSKSEDGKKTWLETGVTEHAYKAPGLRRDVWLDAKGATERVEITDSVRGRKLTYCPKEKKATLAEINPREEGEGPFSGYLQKLSDLNLQWIAKRKTAAGDVNVFRNAFRDQDNERDWSIDFWIDTKTKQLVDVYQPGADIYDPETDPARNAPRAETAWSSQMMGGGECSIRYDAALEDSLFRLQPPEGYAVETKPRDRVTEREMIDYLGIVADFNDKMFPDTEFWDRRLSVKIDRANAKPRQDQTPAERKLLDADGRYGMRFQTVSNAPILVFFAWDPDSVVKNSFRYLGKGVKLGEKNRIVCWYKLKNAKDARTYRVVYGDLSVKDVAPEALPLPVDP